MIRVLNSKCEKKFLNDFFLLQIYSWLGQITLVMSCVFNLMKPNASFVLRVKTNGHFFGCLLSKKGPHKNIFWRFLQLFLKCCEKSKNWKAFLYGEGKEKWDGSKSLEIEKVKKTHYGYGSGFGSSKYE